MPESDPRREQQIANLNAVARHLYQEKVRRESGMPQRGQAGAPEPRRATGGRLARMGALGVALAILLSKAKILLPLLKFWPSLASMFLFMAVYAQTFGWAWALGFVLLIFVHEAGHLIEMRRNGVPAGAPVFIPFVGAVVAMRGMPRNAYVEARVGLGWPLLGTLGTMLLLPFAAQSALIASLAHTGFFINLVNLIPISPLDGGRIAGAISRWLWIVGFAIGLLLLLVTRSGMILVILVLGFITAIQRLRHPIPGYDAIRPAQRVLMTVLYFGLIGALVILISMTPTPDLGFHR